MRIDDLNKEIRDLKIMLNQKDKALRFATEKANKIEKFFNNNFNKMILEFNDFIASENWLKFDREPFITQEEKRKRDKFR